MIMSKTAEELQAGIEARGWTRSEGTLPDGTPKTLIKEGDRELQRQLLARNIGRH